MDDLPKDPKIAGLPVSWPQGRTDPRGVSMKRLILACLGVLLTVTVAYADKPLQTRASSEFPVVIECDDFDVILAHSGNLHTTWFFDKNGVPKTLQIHFRAEVEIYREGFPDNVLYGRRADNQIADFPGGIFTGFVVNGGFIQVNLPGYGPLLFDVGRAYYDADFNVTLIRGANHDRLLQETDALCAYFE